MLSPFTASLRSASKPLQKRFRVIGWMQMSCLACAVGVSACKLGPDYQRPDIPPPKAWRDDPVHASTSWPSASWWQGFQSAPLDAYLAQAQQSNDDLAAAVARVQEADAQARIAGAPLFPSLEGGFEVMHERGSTSTGGLQTFSTFSPTLSASYEVDFWGKNRAARDAARAAADASRYDRVTVQLSVMTSVANTYFQALALRDRLAIAQKNLDTAQTILDDLKLEEEAGTANALDVAQQATTTATLYAAIPPLTQQLRQTVDALAILIGTTPDAVDVDHGALADLMRPAIAPGLPSELLSRRPDVAEAEAQLIAANANIAVARAAFFPRIDLTASGGYESEKLSNLLSPANAIFSLAAALTQPIFEGGTLEGQSDYVKARYTELLASYHKTVISAFSNVEDALVAVRQTAEQERRQQQAAETARRAYEIAQTQLQAGVINVLSLLNTETALFTAEDSLAQVQSAHLQALVNLYGALGGGWQEPTAVTTASSTN